MLIEAICASDDCQLAGALDLPAARCWDPDAGGLPGPASGVAICRRPAPGLQNADVLIDFTAPRHAGRLPPSGPSWRRDGHRHDGFHRRAKAEIAGRRPSPSSWRPT